MMKTTKFYIRNILIALFLVIFVGSCKQYYDPPLVFEPDPGQNLTKDRKVLLISVDGLAGLELKKYTPANITKMLEHAKYTFEAIADGNTHDAASWTTMLSGKGSAKHGVLGNSFISGVDDDDDVHDHNGSGSSTGYISVYQRLLETGKPLKTLSVTPWAELDQYLFSLSDENGAVASDEAAKIKAVDRIKNGEDNLAFSVINFRGVNEAGKSGGFSMENAAYKAALDQIDGYIGEILKAVSERKRNAKEDWMVIITSNHGGVGTSYGGASLEERKIPIIFYNVNFQKQGIESPELVNSLTVDKAGNDIPTLEDPAAYEIGASGEFTILSRVKMITVSGTNSVIYGKTSHAYSATKGWHLMTEAASKKFRFIIGDGTLAYIVSSKPFVANVWYSVALKIYNENGKRYAAIYQDGLPASTPVDITGRNMVAGTANPFFIGPGLAGKSYGVSSAVVNNLAFYDKALTDAEILAYNCKQEILSTDDSYGNLKGYWKLAEGSGNTMANSITTAKPTSFKFTATTLPWNLGTSWNCLSAKEQEEEAKNKRLISQSDILSQVYYWLNVKTADSWGLEGKVFLDAYEKEFIGK